MLSYHDLQDIELIDKSKKGDNQAFKTIVLRYEDRVAATVIGMLGYCPEADDVGQETFVRFYKALNNFRGDSSLATYLTRIAINLSLNELKKRKRKSWLSFFSGSDEDSTEMQIADTGITQDQRDTQQMVQKAIQMLDPKFRSVVVLRMIEGYSTKETAEILELPIGTILSRLKRAQEKLKSILTPMMGTS